ncbi:MarR family winged helix-turn-helix transcriptional regulator [Streptomyces shenzhenensis]|uniref:MarR family winged helix-turn-helix transcriptional regulator n=1 Tax=Streptomyces shenzhenensis TaxID=943815 RepID=UPI00382E03EA
MDSTPNDYAPPSRTEGAGDDGEFNLMALVPRLSQVGTAMSRGSLVERAMQQAAPGLDQPSMNVLMQLRMAGKPLRVGEIAHRMQVVGPHVTRQVNELERRRLARRVVDPDDQRARLVESTPEGTATVERYLHTVFGVFDEALADWSAEDRRAFSRLLGRFADDVAAHLAHLDAQDRDPQRD